MKPIFHHILPQFMPSSPAHLDSLQHVFEQDRSSGLIWLLFNEERAGCYLFHEGRLAARFTVDGDRSQPVTEEEWRLSWMQESFQVASLDLPVFAARMALQALEWRPAQSSWQMLGRDLPGFLEHQRFNQLNGLLSIDLPQAGAYLYLDHGALSMVESVSLMSGVALPAAFDHRQALNSPDADCSVAHYPVNLQSTSGQLLQLRLAVMGWISIFLKYYQGLVGVNLLTALDYETNLSLRLRHYNFRLVSTALLDQHLFLSLLEAELGYRYLFETITAHIQRVIGAGLAARTMNETYQNAPPEHRAILEQHHLAPDRSEVG